MDPRQYPPNFDYLSRRDFVRWFSVPLTAGLTQLLRADMLRVPPDQDSVHPGVWADYRMTPHYRAQSPLDAVLSQTAGGNVLARQGRSAGLAGSLLY